MHSLVSCTRVDKIRRMQRGPAVEKKKSTRMSPDRCDQGFETGRECIGYNR